MFRLRRSPAEALMGTCKYKEDDLAELIALFERLPAAGRRKLLAQIRRSAGKHK